MNNKINNKNLIKEIENIITQAKTKTVTAINTVMVYTYYNTGKMIVEYEQQGKNRANYGSQTIKNLSIHLTDKFGKGWTEENLTLMRKFYKVYSKELNFVNSDYEIQKNNKHNLVNTVYQIDTKQQFILSWSHYLILMRIEDKNERSFYEIETIKNKNIYFQ